MSTGAVVAIAAGAVIILLILLALVSRMRAHSTERRREARRGELASAHRDAAGESERRARLAEREARRERAEADLHEAKADLHEHGLADEELDRDDLGSRGEGDAERHAPRR